MLRKPHVGHGLALGTLIGFGMAGYRPYLILALGVVLGCFLALSLLGGLRLYRQLLSAFEAWKSNSKAKRSPREFAQKHYPGDIPY